MSKSLKQIMFTVVILSSLTQVAFGEDINFITLDDLPNSVFRSFRVSGRGTMPDFPEGHGIKEALKSTHAERTCMSSTGKQLTDWTVHKELGFYWKYSISAKFECLLPTLQAKLTGDKAKTLAKRLKNISTVRLDNNSLVKEAKVLCYDFYTPVCIGNSLQRYRTNQVCELNDMNTSNDIVLRDIFERGQAVSVEGARDLRSSLPVYLDGRRDDDPNASGNCEDHVWGDFKGLSRKAAIVKCSVNNDSNSTTCLISGMIKK